MQISDSLNSQQLEAVRTTEGPLLILAGAGSGKTRVITVRIAHLISEMHVPPHNILAVTFTNKAAGEMRERVGRILEGERLNSAPLVTTFHSLCVRILRQDIEALAEGYTRSFNIYDADDSLKVIKACIKDIGFDDKQLAPRMVLGAISGAKNRGEDQSSFASRVEYTDERRTAIAKVFGMYESRLKLANALDFDDLLIKTVRLLRTSTEVRNKYNERFKYILVDEYQDTNALQFALIGYLTEQQQNICVVGDDAQSIYGFRGADIGNILSFEKHFPSAKVIMLEQNYRSTQKILDAADSIIRNNKGRKEKKLWTANPGGDSIRYFQSVDGDGEARFVATEVDAILRRDPLKRIAVLYRTNAQSRLFEESFRRMRIDYNIVGGFSFYERAEIKDVVSYLKAALNPADDLAILRIINTPARGFGKTSLDELTASARESGMNLWETIAWLTDPFDPRPKRMTPRALESLRKFREIVLGIQTKISESAGGSRPVSETVIAAIEDSGYGNMLRTENSDESAARLENLEELVNAAVEYDAEEDGLRQFIDHAALTSDTDKFDRNAPVTLMTVHSAKGLEFPIVFLVGLEDGIFPHSRSLNEEKELEEERRLAYVAITRAEHTLYVTHSMRRRVYGEEMAAEPSQFLNELPLELIHDMSQGSSWLSYARDAQVEKPAAAARSGLSHRDESPSKPKNLYTGKTYNTTDAISEFFKKRESGGRPVPASEPRQDAPPRPAPVPPAPKTSADSKSGGLIPGTNVIHPKYGKGLVLRREGSGDNVKLTVSFPGFGQKKLMEKFANLTRI